MSEQTIYPVFDKCKETLQWVSMGIFGTADAWDEKAVAIGIERDGRIIAGCVYTDYQQHMIEMHIFSIDPRWATKYSLRALFRYPFIQLNLKRVQALCSANDKGVQMFLKRLGFIHEGVHPYAYHDGGTAYSFGMLKHQCRYI